MRAMRETTGCHSFSPGLEPRTRRPRLPPSRHPSSHCSKALLVAVLRTTSSDNTKYDWRGFPSGTLRSVLYLRLTGVLHGQTTPRRIHGHFGSRLFRERGQCQRIAEKVRWREFGLEF